MLFFISSWVAKAAIKNWCLTGFPCASLHDIDEHNMSDLRSYKRMQDIHPKYKTDSNKLYFRSIINCHRNSNNQSIFDQIDDRNNTINECLEVFENAMLLVRKRQLGALLMSNSLLVVAQCFPK